MSETYETHGWKDWLLAFVPSNDVTDQAAQAAVEKLYVGYTITGPIEAASGLRDLAATLILAAERIEIAAPKKAEMLPERIAALSKAGVDPRTAVRLLAVEGYGAVHFAAELLRAEVARSRKVTNSHD